MLCRCAASAASPTRTRCGCRPALRCGVSPTAPAASCCHIGKAAAVYHARSTAAGEEPRTYTVEPGESVTGAWAAAGAYDISVHGPNGFFRQFSGNGQSPAVSISTEYDSRAGTVTLVIRNRSTERIPLTVRDGCTGRRTRVSLRSGRMDGRDSFSDPAMGGLV